MSGSRFDSDRMETPGGISAPRCDPASDIGDLRNRGGCDPRGYGGSGRGEQSACSKTSPEITPWLERSVETLLGCRTTSPRGSVLEPGGRYLRGRRAELPLQDVASSDRRRSRSKGHRWRTMKRTPGGFDATCDPSCDNGRLCRRRSRDCGERERRERRGEGTAGAKASPAAAPWLEQFIAAFLGRGRDSSRGSLVERRRRGLRGQRPWHRLQDMAAADRRRSRSKGEFGWHVMNRTSVIRMMDESITEDGRDKCAPRQSGF